MQSLHTFCSIGVARRCEQPLTCNVSLVLVWYITSCNQVGVGGAVEAAAIELAAAAIELAGASVPIHVLTGKVFEPS